MFVLAVIALVPTWVRYGSVSALTVFLALSALTIALVFGAAIEARFFQLRQKLDGIEKGLSDLKKAEAEHHPN